MPPLQLCFTRFACEVTTCRSTCDAFTAVLYVLREGITATCDAPLTLQRKRGIAWCVSMTLPAGMTATALDNGRQVLVRVQAGHCFLGDEHTATGIFMLEANSVQRYYAGVMFHQDALTSIVQYVRSDPGADALVVQFYIAATWPAASPLEFVQHRAGQPTRVIIPPHWATLKWTCMGVVMFNNCASLDVMRALYSEGIPVSMAIPDHFKCTLHWTCKGPLSLAERAFEVLQLDDEDVVAARGLERALDDAQLSNHDRNATRALVAKVCHKIGRTKAARAQGETWKSHS